MLDAPAWVNVLASCFDFSARSLLAIIRRFLLSEIVSDFPMFKHCLRYCVLGRERQVIHGLDHQAACNAWGQDGVSCQAVVCTCCVGFSYLPILSHSIRRSLPNNMRGWKRAINCGDAGMSQIVQIGLIGIFAWGFDGNIV